ncbi:hypothetical protein M9458_041450, partial [Cirrhinus mrigala]
FVIDRVTENFATFGSSDGFTVRVGDVCSSYHANPARLTALTEQLVQAVQGLQ